MRIQFVEIQNFRKLKSIRVEFAEKTTLLVGANNSGKTSAMVALGHFLIDHNRFTTNDFTLSNWTRINSIGTAWEDRASQPGSESPDLAEWEGVLPILDVWLQVANDEIHYVTHLLPTLEWEGGLLGVRLRLEPKSPNDLYKEYLSAVRAANAIKRNAAEQKNGGEYTVELWPRTMHDFLARRLHSLFTVRAYSLDPTKREMPVKGVAHPQPLPSGSEPIEGDLFKGLIRIDEINAQRGFVDANSTRDRTDNNNQEIHRTSEKRKLSDQLRSYYAKHLDPSKSPEPTDLDALQAIDTAQTQFDEKLKNGFTSALSEIQDLGYPGVTDPKLIISTRIRPTDGLNHEAAVQYEVISQNGGTVSNFLRLPEEYNGLGYQNLISMVFMLMSFRDGWMQVGKAAKNTSVESREVHFPPLHLVLIEEPEAHLHAQVQQVFIRKAYDVLRKHDDLGEKINLRTQLVVSTHSSHIAHECEFSCLRYFRRMPAVSAGQVPTATVINLSEVFGVADTTEKFVIRYLKATHCDLLFADAAILIEGPAERMLVPHFIREHFPYLNQRYITLLEIGGSHAHRLRQLIEHLGLITLIITDLDAADSDGRHPARQPVKGRMQLTRNSTLKGWVPEKKLMDELLDASAADKVKDIDRFSSIRVAYQCPVIIHLNGTDTPVEALSNTFEDALVFENIPFFSNLEGDGLIKEFKDAIAANKTPDALGNAMFDILKTGNKAEFALNLLFLADPTQLNIPTYIKEGLSWLQDQLQQKKQDVLSQQDKLPQQDASPRIVSEARNLAGVS